jgi:hypothetical protein
MTTFRKTALMAVMLMAAAASFAFSQEAPRKLIRFTIDTPFEIKMKQLVLPAGKYILHQVTASDANLFNLHQNDLTQSPIAVVRTSRIDYSTTGYPEQFKLFLSNEESNQGDHPVLTGWAVSGTDGWEIVSVVTHKDVAQRQVITEEK